MAEGSRSKRIKYEEQVPWKRLPLVPLVKIYSFLSREDQYNMAEVCEEWYEGFVSGTNWKTYRFALTEDMLSMDPWRLKDIVDQKAGTLKKVLVKYCLGNVGREKIESWIKQFNTFMEILTKKSQLISVEICHLGALFYCVDKPIYENICGVIADFLVSQSQLERVQFSHSFFEYNDGVELLKKANENNGNSLSHLELRTFVRNGPDLEEQDQILPTLVDSPTLVSLHMDYSLVLGKYANPSDVIDTLTNCKKPLKLKILLFAEQFTSSFKKLESNDWTYLKEANQQVKIEIYVGTHSEARQQNEFFIVSDMPIRVLHFVHPEKCPDSEIYPFFNHLLSCNTNKRLRVIFLEFKKSIPDLESAVLPFIKACNKLKIIYLKTVYPVNGLNVLLQFLSRNRPQSLQKFKLKVFEIGNEDNKTMLEELTSKFVQVLNLDVRLAL